ncbi:hypothetical protein GPECTOR_9g719 [Gonium pectorale]|uniref:Uncharacterized protein n=1 Tax=Gonium pectorale TaxID=33097 RepID=A0A150GS68_GONPE|nr:hypothetical protein GPECTOR_9g719 [Gonium pectorale]|eukprot:KXZ52673.1 hypothetical protein GPECTOR_9g719 [Gonium pectorale]
MACATGLCVLCNVEVTEEDHRREIDCPSKSCPGRVYHEDCIAGYLKRTKYSKDRCTGFPCPAILATGKQCPGYVCKMHQYFPSNQAKKKKKLDAIVAAAAAPKPKPPPGPKPKAGAQVAIAAIKRAAPEGFPQPVTTNAKALTASPGSKAPTVEQRLIPGLDGPIKGGIKGGAVNRDELRAQVARLRAEAKQNNGRPVASNVLRNANAGSKVVDAAKGVVAEDSADRAPQGATIWDAFSKAANDKMMTKAFFGDEDGKFTKLLRKRLEGNSSGVPSPDWDNSTNDESVSECESDITARGRESEESGLSAAASVAELLAFPTTLPTLADAQITDFVTVPGLMVVPFADPDPVVEHDIVYGAEDGSYLVLDSVSNAYYRLVDVYGEDAKLEELPAEDGNVYTCVAVRKSQVAAREERQRAWLQEQFAGALLAPHAQVPPQPELQLPAQQVITTVAADAAQSCAMTLTQEEEDDGTDVESLMQLLCV